MSTVKTARWWDFDVGCCKKNFDLFATEEPRQPLLTIAAAVIDLRLMSIFLISYQGRFYTNNQKEGSVLKI